MKHSTERTLTTHAGSLARPHELLETMKAKEHGESYDPGLFEAQVRAAVAAVVRRQVDCGLDIVCDGEQGKVSFATYVGERLSGFEPTTEGMSAETAWQAEVEMFPDYYRRYFEKYAGTVAPFARPVCTGPIAYTGHAAVRRDIDNLKAALEGLDFEDAFMPAVAPGGFGTNTFYPG